MTVKRFVEGFGDTIVSIETGRRQRAKIDEKVCSGSFDAHQPGRNIAITAIATVALQLHNI